MASKHSERKSQLLFSLFSITDKIIQSGSGTFCWLGYLDGQIEGGRGREREAWGEDKKESVGLVVSTNISRWTEKR